MEHSHQAAFHRVHMQYPILSWLECLNGGHDETLVQKG
jgi:hypothetical protein